MEATGLLALILQYKYGLLILITAVEGPIAMLAAGFLIKLGLLSIPLALLALVFGDLLGDTFWYAVGYFARHSVVLRFGARVGLTEEKFKKLEEMFQRHAIWILVVSKCLSQRPGYPWLDFFDSRRRGHLRYWLLVVYAPAGRWVVHPVG